MTLHERRLISSCGSLALVWATGCADPCIDDGLSQENPSMCPGASGSDTTDGPEPTTTDPTADETSDPPSCDNGIQDGDETDVDCGGSCQDKCGGGQGCEVGDDCTSQECGMGMTCEGPSCTDGLQNGDETDVDCGGGSCPPCEDGDTCNVGPDCESMMCADGTCGGGGPSCRDGIVDGNETDVDCGGPDCEPCDDGEDCLVDDDCVSQLCDPRTNTCAVPSCTDGVQNGGETDEDCGGPCGATCEPGEGCLVGMDCLSFGCDAGTNVCNDYLSVDAAPSCSSYDGLAPASLTATASGGSGMYTYAWTPDDGSLSAPDQAMTDATPSGFESYTVMVDDGFAMAQDDVVVVSSQPFDLQNNCTLYASDFDPIPPPTISYDMAGTRACELGNNDFGLHLCEGTNFQNIRLQGTLEVLAGTGDDDMMGLVWGAQGNLSSFYSLTWKAVAQDFFGCSVPTGIVVKRVDAPMLSDLTAADVYCPADTAQSTLLLDPTGTTAQPWVAGQSYDVTIDFTDAGSTVTVVRNSDGMELANFVIADATFTSGFFGSTTFSQTNACVGPLFAECL